MAYVKDNLLNDLYETVLKLLSSKKDYDDFIYKSPFSLIAPDSEIIYSDDNPFPRKMTVEDLMNRTCKKSSPRPRLKLRLKKLII